MLTEKEIDILGHTLGINVYHAKISKKRQDKKLPKEFYRNYFCANTTHDEFTILNKLQKDGWMKSWEQFNNLYFCVKPSIFGLS